jgi:GAF domain-containing protein
VLELLRLLAQDAPVERIEEAADELVASDPRDGPAARTLALAIRAGIDARRRRETELAALVDIARDLAAHSDPAAVLDTIVRRARALLATDVAYLTLSDPEHGDTYMRATSGSVSARFQTLRLPAGAGLGGLVAQTRRPYWTADYPADERYRHTSEIDAAVSEEGLVAICGTPLLVEGAFVGVLFAANRTRRPFRRDEVALLGSLAALAAVSLVQTRRSAETEAALGALSTAHAGIAEAATAHDRFTEVVLGGGGVDAIAAALGELLGCWVVVLDSDGERLAAFGTVPDVLEGRSTGRLVHADGQWSVAVTAVGQRLGTLVLGGPDELNEGQGRTVERAAMVTALVLLFRLRAAEADHRVRADLLADLLRSTAPDRALVERGRLLGLRLRQPHVVVVCRGERPRGLLLAASQAGSGAGLSGEHGDATVALVPGRDPSAIAHALARRFAVTVGTAGPIVPAEGVAHAFAEARTAADTLVALGRSGHGAALADLGFVGLVAAEAPDVDGYLARVLGPLLDYDAARGTDLVATLDAYFACGASPRRAAVQLHVHANTVAQRLDRIGALLGADWSEPERALELQLALRLRRVRG